MTNLKHFLLTSIPLAGLVAALVSCDGKPYQTDADRLVAGNRYDTATLVANPTDIVKMPTFISGADTFTHDSFVVGDNDEGNAIFVNEFHATGTLQLNSAGQILTTEGASTFPTTIHRYEVLDDQTAASYRLTGNSTYADITDLAASALFEAQIRTVIDSGANSAGSLLEDIEKTRFPNKFNPAILQTCATLDIPASGLGNSGVTDDLVPGENTSNYDPTKILILKNREIIYTPTSTNADLIATNTIKGTFEYEDIYYHVIIADDFVNQNRVILVPKSAPGDEAAAFSGVAAPLSAPCSGSFTINLGSL